MSIRTLGLINPDVRERVTRKHNGKCMYCGCGGFDGMPHMGMQMDHIKPTSGGGDDIEENLGLACYKCNNAKSNRPLEDFREWISVRIHNAYWGIPKFSRDQVAWLVSNGHDFWSGLNRVEFAFEGGRGFSHP